MKAVFPGTFDPVTNGHLDVARRAARLFDHLVVAVYDDPPKRLLFNMEERVGMFRDALGKDADIEIVPYSGLTVEFARKISASVIIRGLRIGADFEYEREMALMNRKMYPEIEVACLIASLENQYVSSTRVKEIAALGGEVNSFVPSAVAEAVRQRIACTSSKKRA